MITLIDKKAFTKMNKARRRVALAKDVIARLDAKLIAPYSGSLFTPSTKWKLLDVNNSLQENLNTRECSACAKGALICSWVGNFNHYSKEEFGRFNYDFQSGPEAYPKELIDLFGTEQLSIIEREFEQSQYSWCVVKDSNFESNYDSPYYKDLRAIMENIIKNKGTFIP